MKTGCERLAESLVGGKRKQDSNPTLSYILLPAEVPIQAVRAMGDIRRWNHAPVNAHLDLNDVVTVSHLVQRLRV
jgi:hypothetical protein